MNTRDLPLQQADHQLQKIRRALLDCNGIRFWRDRLALVQAPCVREVAA